MNDNERARELFFKGLACLEKRDFYSSEQLFYETLKFEPHSVPKLNHLEIEQYKQGIKSIKQKKKKKKYNLNKKKEYQKKSKKYRSICDTIDLSKRSTAFRGSTQDLRKDNFNRCDNCGSALQSWFCSRQK